MNTIKYIEDWLKAQCDGNWEHDYGIKIETIDNPGWSIEIDLVNTEFENYNKDWELIEKSESDWYGIKIKDSKFNAFGDLKKLEFLLNKFIEITEKKHNS